MKKIKVAVFPAGSEIGLEIYNALKKHKDIEVIGFTSEDDHSAYAYDDVYKVPYVKDKFYSGFNKYCFNAVDTLLKDHNVDVLFPAHDLIIDWICEIGRSKFSSRIVMPPTSITKTFRNKASTYAALPSISPKVFENEDYMPEGEGIVVIKPINGFGSKGVEYFYENEHLEEFWRWKSDKEKEKYVTTEYIPGKEYTIDCMSLWNGKTALNVRTRDRIKNGISIHSETVPTDHKSIEKCQNIVTTVLNKFPEMVGPWFIQVKEDKNGVLKLLEIAPRIAGTSGVTRVAGWNIPLMAVYNAMEINVTLTQQQHDYTVKVDRALSSRYSIDYSYDTVFVDLDDTLIIDGKVNAELMMFLYQCKNEGKRVNLITRNENPCFTLRVYSIDRCLFSSIFSIPQIKSKAFDINNSSAKNSIFIDDSFKEREDVEKNCKNCLAFDVSEVSALIDWKK